MSVQRRLKADCSFASLIRAVPASIIYKYTADRYRPVSYPDGPITARYRYLCRMLTGLVVYMTKVCLIGYPKGAQRRFWSDCANGLDDCECAQSIHVPQSIFSHDTGSYILFYINFIYYFNGGKTILCLYWICCFHKCINICMFGESFSR